jgi:lipopolysaccharide biosynthesis glycosyltransferase
MKLYTPIAFCFDENFVDYAMVALCSVIHSATASLKIYWITFGPFSEKIEKSKNHINELFNIEINLIYVNEKLFDGWKVNGHIKKSAYLRLLLPSVVNEKKIIYLDCDILVLTDLCELYNADLSELKIAGVADPFGGLTSRIFREADDVYVNSGVLLINVESLRKHNFLEKCKQIYLDNEEKIIYHDQCIINKYFEGKKNLLDSKWNRQVVTRVTNEEKWRFVSNPDNTSVLHFIGPEKPWQEWCNPIISEFWWAFAQRVKGYDIESTKISTIEHMKSYANVHDYLERYKEASLMKNLIIDKLTG